MNEVWAFIVMILLGLLYLAYVAFWTAHDTV